MPVQLQSFATQARAVTDAAGKLKTSNASRKWYLQGKNGQLEHLYSSANANDSQCLDDGYCPKQQNDFPAKEHKPNDIGYAGERMDGIGPGRGMIVKSPDL